ncbi:Ig-like domain-containing protein [Intrasporangium mesophilum]
MHGPSRTRRGLLTAATAFAVMGMQLSLAPAAPAATGSLASVANADNSSRTDGAATDPLLLTAGGPCSASATRSVVMVSKVTAAVPADQPRADAWRGELVFAQSSPPPSHAVVARLSSFVDLADTLTHQIVAGRWDLLLACQDANGNLVDDWRGSLTFDSAAHWTADPLPAATGTSTVAPVLTPSVGAKGGDTSGSVPSSSAAGAGSSTTSPTSPEGVSLSVTPTNGPAYQQVRLTGSIQPPGSGGQCTFSDIDATIGTVPLDASGSCVFVSSAFAQGAHTFAVSIVPAGSTTPLDSRTVDAAYGAPADPDALSATGSITTTVPTGSLAIFTPYTPANPLDLGSLVLSADGRAYSAAAPFDAVRVTDTRAGNPGWSASLVLADLVGGRGADRISAAYAGFVDVTPAYVPGDAITTLDVRDIPPAANRPSGPVEFARAAPGAGTGSVDVRARLVLKDVPTSTLPGRYTTTITFTVG